MNDIHEIHVFRWASKIFKISSRTRIIPFDFTWTKHGAILRFPVQPRWKLLIPCVSLGHGGFLVYQAIVFWKHFIPNDLFSELAAILILSTAFALTASFQFHALLYGSEVTECMNQLVHFTANMTEYFGETEFKKNKQKLDKIILLVGGIAVEIVFCYGILAIAFPKQKFLFTSLLSDDHLSGPVVAFLGVLQALMDLTYWGSWAMETYFILMYMETTKIALTFLITSGERLAVQERHKLYSKMRILNTIFNSGFAPFFFPCFQFILGSYSVISVYGAIKLISTHKYSLVVLILVYAAVFSMSVQLFFYPKAGVVQELSGDFFVTASKKSNLSRYEKSLLKSFRPISVKIGMFYCVKKRTTLSLLNGIVGYTITLMKF